MSAPSSLFRQDICDAGLVPPLVITPGEVHYFPGRGKDAGSRAGCCLLSANQRTGLFGDLSTGLEERWQLENSLSAAIANTEMVEPVLSVQARVNAENLIRQVLAHKRANRIWNSATPACHDHPYLQREGIGPHRARTVRDSLVLPIRSFSGELTNLQYISPQGSKYLLTEASSKGCFISVSRLQATPRRVILCEGWAIGCRVAEANPAEVVLAAIDLENLESVAVAARYRWPEAQMIIAGHDGRLAQGNRGVIRALASARDRLTLPSMPGGTPLYVTDFNGLALWLKEARYEQ